MLNNQMKVEMLSHNIDFIEGNNNLTKLSHVVFIILKILYPTIRIP